MISCHIELAEKADKTDRPFCLHITHYSPANLEVFKLLKGYYSNEQWEKQREEVFEAIGTNRNLNKLYREEKLYDRIIAAIEREPRRPGGLAQFELNEITSYEDVLRPQYDERLLALHETIAQNIAKPTSGRNGYKEVVKVLNRMLKYPNGKEAVDRLIEEWRTTYSNRPAMQDELGRVYNK